jgi:hypothetical protein
MKNQPDENISLELDGGVGVGVLPATVENVRSTCDRAAADPGSPVRIDEEGLSAFMAALDPALVKRSSHLMDVSISFQDTSAAVNFHITLHLFNFGHGFRHPLHEAVGLGAWQTMKRGIANMHEAAGGAGIDAAMLSGLTAEKVDTFFGLSALGKSPAADALDPLRRMILRVAASTGDRLRALGSRSFADMIRDHASSRISSGEVVELLAENFPAFNDRRSLGHGREVLFLKKAQIAVAELYQKLGNGLADIVDFSDITMLTVACDNVLPCVLKCLGILRLDPDLERRIAAGRMLPAGTEEARLRASALSAAETIVRRSGGAFWSKELGDYLWTLGKEPQFRKVERHATRDTCFY